MNRIAHWDRICQLIELASFDYLLHKSHPKTDEHDARADDLPRRFYDKRLKTKSIQNAAERLCGSLCKRISAQLRNARLWIFLFVRLSVACAWLGERSEPTCIRQAHVTVPRWKFTKYSTAICIPIDELVIAFSYRICYDDIIIQIRSELWRHLITMVNETKKCKIHSLIEPIVRNRLLTFLLEGCTI